MLTVVSVGTLLYSSYLFGVPVWATQTPVATYQKPAVLKPKTITGIPIRIVIPSAVIDLPLDPGVYNSTTGQWSLSQVHAQYAVITAPANNEAGTTFVYGHGTHAIFGKIGLNPPPAGTIAYLYTNNNHVFSYTLQSVHAMQPTNTSILDNTSDGPPRLIIQTCTGIFSQWRTMFIFSYEKVQ